MINLLKLSYILIFLNCASIGYQTIYSPQSNYGKDIHYRIPDCSVPKESPPNALEINAINEDSISLFVWSEVLDHQTTRFGFIVPFIPNFLSTKKESLEKSQEQLKISLFLNVSDTLHIEQDSIFILIDNSLMYPYQIAKNLYIVDTNNPVINKVEAVDLDFLRYGSLYISQPFIFYYHVNTFEVEHFNLYVRGLYLNNHLLHFPVITFNKAKQRIRCLGP